MKKQTVLKKIGIILLLSLFMLTPTVAWASSFHDGTVTIPQGIQTGYTSEMALDGGSIHFLSTASAWNVILNETTYTVTLQKKGILGIWSSINSVSLPNNSNSSITFTGNSSGIYRFKLSRPRWDSGQVAVYYQVLN